MKRMLTTMMALAMVGSAGLALAADTQKEEAAKAGAAGHGEMMGMGGAA